MMRRLMNAEDTPVIVRRLPRRRPDWAIVSFKSLPYVLHVRALRRALIARAVDNEFSTIGELADRARVSRSTVSRFFAGRSTSLEVAFAILRELELAFEDVCSPLEGELLRQAEQHVIVRDGAAVLTVDPRTLA